MALSTTYTKAEVDLLLQKQDSKIVGVYQGDLNISDAAPINKGIYALLEAGTYTNLGNINAEAGILNFASFDGTTWSLLSTNIDPKKLLIEKIMDFNSGEVIASNGGFVGLAQGWVSYYCEVTQGEELNIKANIPSSGTFEKKAYAFYSDKPFNATTYISGGNNSADVIDIDENVIVPNNAKYIVITTTGNTFVYKATSIINTVDYRYRINYNALNLTPFPFLKQTNKRINFNEGLVENQTENINYALNNDNFKVVKLLGFFGDEYLITEKNNNAFDLSKVIFQAKGKQNTTISLWINTADLNGNGINFCLPSITNAQLKTKGFKGNFFNTFSVNEVKGDWSQISIHIETTSIVSSMSIVGTNSMTQLRIANPQIVDGLISVDPYYQYESLAEKNNSKLIGKSIVFFGDSQLKNEQIDFSDKYLGASVHLCQEGGRSIKYRTGFTGVNDYNWLYHHDRLKYLKDLQGDVFVFHLSTNDGDGGGVLTESSIALVKEKYPTINDDSSAVASKLAIFNAMSESERESTFNFKSVYGALIQQILEYNQNARIVLCTIPTSRGSETEYSNIRNRNSQINNDIIELSKFFNAPLIDIHNLVNLTAENAGSIESDGTHWTTLITNRIGHIVANNLLNLII